MIVDVVDPVSDYAALMEGLFDFPAIRAMFAGGFRMRMDSMCAVTGPYAVKILERRLGAAAGTCVNATPLPDFGGIAPRPEPDLGQGADGRDVLGRCTRFGPQAMATATGTWSVGRGIYVSPSDSLAVLAANAHLAPGYAKGLKGVARSMPTVRRRIGWRMRWGSGNMKRDGMKFFGTFWMQVAPRSAARKAWHRVGPCAREGRALGRASVAETFWRSGSSRSPRFFVNTGRSTGATTTADTISRRSRRQRLTRCSRAARSLSALAGRVVEGMTISAADDFAYTDPVDGSVSQKQACASCSPMAAGSSIACRVTGTEGADLARLSGALCGGAGGLDHDAQEALAPVIRAAHALAGIAGTPDGPRRMS